MLCVIYYVVLSITNQVKLKVLLLIIVLFIFAEYFHLDDSYLTDDEYVEVNFGAIRRILGIKTIGRYLSPTHPNQYVLTYVVTYLQFGTDNWMTVLDQSKNEVRWANRNSNNYVFIVAPIHSNQMYELNYINERYSIPSG